MIRAKKPLSFKLKGFSLSFLGQICLTFSLLWIPVSLFAMVLYGLLDRKISATARKNTRFS